MQTKITCHTTHSGSVARVIGFVGIGALGVGGDKKRPSDTPSSHFRECYEASTEFTMIVAKWHVRRTSRSPKALSVALSFYCLLGLGCPKQAFAKIAISRSIKRHNP
jgi:hypothetical protein